MSACQTWRVAALAVVLSAALGACGQASGKDLEAAREAGRSQGAAQQKAEAEKEKLRQDVAALKKQQEQLLKKVNAGGSTAAGTSGSSVKNASGSHDCGSGVRVNSVTSCSFADIVAREWRNNGGGSVSFDAWSPVTQRWYPMRCSAGMPTICRGGSNAVVYIR